MQEERRLAVLRAIVEDFVATEEPVGSKALVERHGLNVSPATVRNDMAALEEEGYITQRPGTRDRRQRLLELTPKGAELERQLSEGQRALVARAYRAAGAEAVDGGPGKKA